MSPGNTGQQRGRARLQVPSAPLPGRARKAFLGRPNRQLPSHPLRGPPCDLGLEEAARAGFSGARAGSPEGTKHAKSRRLKCAEERQNRDHSLGSRAEAGGLDQRGGDGPQSLQGTALRRLVRGPVAPERDPLSLQPGGWSLSEFRVVNASGGDRR